MNQNLQEFARGITDWIKRDKHPRYVYMDHSGRFRRSIPGGAMFRRLEEECQLIGVYDTRSTQNDIFDDLTFALAALRAREKQGRLASGART